MIGRDWVMFLSRGERNCSSLNMFCMAGRYYCCESAILNIGRWPWKSMQLLLLPRNMSSPGGPPLASRLSTAFQIIWENPSNLSDVPMIVLPTLYHLPLGG